MQKIISLFKRNYDGDRLVRDEVVEGAEWVIAGEGVATRKFDGTCCQVLDGALYKRYDLKRGKKAPAGFAASQDPDPVTGAQPGWVPVGEGPEDTHHREGLRVAEHRAGCSLPNGTYELIGPKAGGGNHDGANPEHYPHHDLIRHGAELLSMLGVPRTFEALRDYLADRDIEGIVFHHPDGRMVKVKSKDFGLKRKSLAESPT